LDDFCFYFYNSQLSFISLEIFSLQQKKTWGTRIQIKVWKYISQCRYLNKIFYLDNASFYPQTFDIFSESYLSFRSHSCIAFRSIFLLSVDAPVFRWDKAFIRTIFEQNGVVQWDDFDSVFIYIILIYWLCYWSLNSIYDWMGIYRTCSLQYFSQLGRFVLQTIYWNQYCNQIIY
jgi:hypothetical protein